MGVLSKLASFFYNHRRKFLFFGSVLGTAIAAYQYASYKVRENEELEMQDMLESVRRQRYFETVQDTCNDTILDFDLTFRQTLSNVSRVNHLLEMLNDNPSNKIEIWEHLKLATFTHLAILIHVEPLLVALLRIQVGIIGGYQYKEKITDKVKFKRMAQEKFLSLFIQFTKIDLKKFYDYVKSKVDIVMSKTKLTQNINVHSLQEILWLIQTSINNNNKWIDYFNDCLNIDSLIDKSTDPVLKNVYQECSDILRNKEVATAVTSCVSSGFTYFIDQISVHIPIGNKTPNVANGLNHKQGRSCITIAKLLPVIYNVGLNECDIATTWLRQLIACERLRILSANVYEAYCE